MNKLKSTLKILSLSALVFLCLQNISAQNSPLLNQAERITGDRFTIAAQTPKGALVYAVNRPNNKMLDAIDKGLTDLFAVAADNGYRRRLNYSDYTIFIAKADRTQNKDKNYSPDIAVGAAQYAGTDFDQGGFIYAAGMVLGYNPCAFVFAEHTKNFERVSEVVRYEGEHLVLYHNDRRLYKQTADHSRGGGHPILK